MWLVLTRFQCGWICVVVDMGFTYYMHFSVYFQRRLSIDVKPRLRLIVGHFSLVSFLVFGCLFFPHFLFLWREFLEACRDKTRDVSKWSIRIFFLDGRTDMAGVQKVCGHCNRKILKQWFRRSEENVLQHHLLFRLGASGSFLLRLDLPAPPVGSSAGT